MHSLDGLREVLGARDGETVHEAAERVVRERDAAIGTVRCWCAPVIVDEVPVGVAPCHRHSDGDWNFDGFVNGKAQWSKWTTNGAPIGISVRSE